MHIEHRIRFIFFPSIFHRDLRPDPRINYSTPLSILWLRGGNRADDIGSGKLGARSALEFLNASALTISAAMMSPSWQAPSFRSQNHFSKSLAI